MACTRITLYTAPEQLLHPKTYRPYKNSTQTRFRRLDAAAGICNGKYRYNPPLRNQHGTGSTIQTPYTCPKPGGPADTTHATKSTAEHVYQHFLRELSYGSNVCCAQTIEKSGPAAAHHTD